MKVRSSLKSLKNRHKDNQLVIRGGVPRIINKKDRRYNAKQG
ncbi:MAG: 50S ribosomal protein L36 [Rickettsiaceae bacterium]|nr:MAG: 50S ribosomal protein L36 [Rickettsiaceae bacterium]